MNRIRVLCHWKGTGTKGDPFRPEILDDHPHKPGERMSDLTGQKPPANAAAAPPFTVQLLCTDQTLAAIMANPKYQGKVTRS